MTNTPRNRDRSDEKPEPYLAQSQPRRGGSQRQGLGETVLKAFIRSVASSLGRIIARAITGRMR